MLFKQVALIMEVFFERKAHYEVKYREIFLGLFL
jgi:hypothetical protein